MAVVLRLFRGGHDPACKSHLQALYLMLAANLLNIVGFTFVAEAPSGEYLATHPSAFWGYVETHLRSNADPSGLELTRNLVDPESGERNLSAGGSRRESGHASHQTGRGEP